MNVTSAIHALLPDANYDAAPKPQKNDSSATPSLFKKPSFHFPMESELLKRYVQDTLAENQEMEDSVSSYGLEYSMSFGQESYKKLLFQAFPEVLNAIPEKEHDEGLCMGLSAVWLRQRLEGKSDAQVHESLMNPVHDVAIFQMLSSQHTEQFKVSLEEPMNAYSEQVAPGVGMEVTSTSLQTPNRTIPLTPVRHFVQNMENILHSNAPQQALFLLTDDHAMGMLRDQQNCLHFFDPNFGVITAEKHNREDLYNFISNLFAPESPEDNNELHITEVKLSAYRQEASKVPTHVMTLMESSSSSDESDSSDDEADAISSSNAKRPREELEASNESDTKRPKTAI